MVTGARFTPRLSLQEQKWKGIVGARTFHSSGEGVFRVITSQKYSKGRIFRMLCFFLICTDLETIKCHVAMKTLRQQCTKTKLGVGKHFLSCLGWEKDVSCVRFFLILKHRTQYWETVSFSFILMCFIRRGMMGMSSLPRCFYLILFSALILFSFWYEYWSGNFFKQLSLYLTFCFFLSTS